MAKSSVTENAFIDAFKIFFNSIKLYFMNFEIFLKLLAFPVLGQVLGLFLVFTLNYFFIMHVPQIAKTNELFNNITFVFTLLVIVLIPCFLIFAKAFLDYVVYIASTTLMANHILDKGRLTDVEILKDVMKPRLFGYFALLIILSLVFCILSFPLLWILLIPVAILWSLAVTAYVLEDNISPFAAIQRSYLFVRYNFFKTLVVLILLTALCYGFLPNLFNWFFDKMNFALFVSAPVDLYVNLLPINELNSLLAQIPYVKFQFVGHEISLFIIQATITFCVVGFTLPIRTIACCELYRDLRGKNITKDDTELKKIVKRATDK